MRSTDGPSPGSIEPRIHPLVDALNATGLVETSTSCEGHYPRRRPGDPTDREQAHVGFVRREGVPEKRLARFLESIVPDPRLGGAGGTALTIAKHHVPPLDGGGPEVFFEIIVRPLDPRASSEAKRGATDRMLALVTHGVERAAFRVLFATQDQKEGTRALLEKRAPTWRGR